MNKELNEVIAANRTGYSLVFTAMFAFVTLTLSTPTAAFYYAAACNKVGCFCAPGDNMTNAAGTTCEHALPEHTGSFQLPAGGVSLTMHRAPAGTLTLLTPGLGNTTATGFGPVYGPPSPVQVTLNKYEPGI